MRKETRRALLTSVLLIAGVGGLIAATFATTGAPPGGVSAILLWISLAGGLLRLAGVLGKFAKTRSKPVRTEVDAFVPAGTLDEPQPLRIERTVAPDEAMSEGLAPLEVDLRLLGVDSRASLGEIRRAFWTARRTLNLADAVDASRAAELYFAYRRLRKMLLPPQPLRSHKGGN